MTAVRQAARWGGVLPITRETPNLDEARAEFLADRPPLAVEALDARLRRLLPGAQLDETTPGRVAVRFEGREVTGWSVREAVERAVALWGSR